MNIIEIKIDDKMHDRFGLYNEPAEKQPRSRFAGFDNHLITLRKHRQTRVCWVLLLLSFSNQLV